MNLHTGKSEPLGPPDLSACCPRLSPGGEYYSYHTDTNPPAIFSSPLTEFRPKTIAQPGAISWSWEPAARAVLFTGPTGGKILRADLNSATTAPFISHPELNLFQVEYSPDQQWLAFLAVRITTPLEFSIRIAPLRNGLPAPEPEWRTVVSEGNVADKPRWNPNGNGIYFVSNRDGNLCIWEQELDPTTKRPLAEPIAVRHFHDPRLSLSAVCLTSLQLEISTRHIFINLAEPTANIWQTQIPPAGGS